MKNKTWYAVRYSNIKDKNPELLKQFTSFFGWLAMFNAMYWVDKNTDSCDGFVYGIIESGSI